MDNKEKTLFHIAAILYNSKSGNVKRDNILKKIIESIIVLNENRPQTCTEISVEINNKIHMLVVEEEILDIVSNVKNRSFAIDYSFSEIYVCLRQERFEYIMNVNERNMESYVKEFVRIKGYAEDTKSLIERYLYNFYCKNVNDLSNLLGDSSKLALETAEYLPEENEIIQEFIEWDNPDKNEMLIAVANYALEYLLIAGNNEIKNKKSFRSIFANKKLYIDTNILFYCIGINGSVYEEANKSFLKKCKDCNEQIIVSYYTDKEFKDTIEHFTSELERLSNPLMHNAQVKRRIHDMDVYNCYLEWASTRQNLREPKYFKAFLMEKYTDILTKYKIQVERAEPFREDVLRQSDTYCNYEQQIPCDSVINYDARNVYFIESKRNPSEVNLQTANIIFISADKGLQRWDENRERNTAPVVVAPNLWLLLLARLISRSDDDLKCFISYINLVSRDPVISNKEFLEVVKVINDIVADVKQQESVISVMVEEEFAFLYNNGEKRTSYFIEKKTEEKTYLILEKEISDLKKDVEQLQDTMVSSKKRNSELEQIIKGKDEVISAQQTVITDTEQINETDRKKNYIEYHQQENEIFRLKQQLKIFKTCVIILPILILLNGVMVYEFIDIFIMKNQNPVTLQVFNYLVDGSIYKPDNKLDIYFNILYAVANGIILAIDTVLIKVIYKVCKKKKAS